LVSTALRIAPDHNEFRLRHARTCVRSKRTSSVLIVLYARPKIWSIASAPSIMTGRICCL
jgi:hypothetical protein